MNKTCLGNGIYGAILHPEQEQSWVYYYSYEEMFLILTSFLLFSLTYQNVNFIVTKGACKSGYNMFQLLILSSKLLFWTLCHFLQQDSTFNRWPRRSSSHFLSFSFLFVAISTPPSLVIFILHRQQTTVRKYWTFTVQFASVAFIPNNFLLCISHF